MKHTRSRLALLGAVAVVLAMLAAAAVFNLFLGWKVEADAISDLEYALGRDDDAMGTGRVPNYIWLDSSYRIEEDEQRMSTQDEEKLAAWYAQHPTQDVVEHITLDDWTGYAAIEAYGPRENYSVGGEWDGRPHPKSGYFIAYIDITSEQSLIGSINMTFAIITILGAGAAAAAGYMAGIRIDKANLAQKRFYENMSHELKTPLAAIRGMAEGSRRGIMDVDVAMRSIERETVRATETIDEMLSLSRIEAGAVTPRKEPVVVEDFVQDCLMPFEGTVRSRGLDVQLDLVAGSTTRPTVDADPDLFEHAFTNVLLNAMRHAATTVIVSYDGSQLRVWNDGSVPSQEQLAHLFDRFYTGEHGSTGVGLAIAQEIANLHGWRLEAVLRNGGLEMAFGFSKREFT